MIKVKLLYVEESQATKVGDHCPRGQMWLMGVSRGPNDITFLHDNHNGVLRIISSACGHKVHIRINYLLPKLDSQTLPPFFTDFSFHSRAKGKRSHRQISSDYEMAGGEGKERKDWLNE